MVTYELFKIQNNTKTMKKKVVWLIIFKILVLHISVPSPNVFVQVNPFQLTFDALTCVWLNRFTQSVAAGLVSSITLLSLIL